MIARVVAVGKADDDKLLQYAEGPLPDALPMPRLAETKARRPYDILSYDNALLRTNILLYPFRYEQYLPGTT